MSENTVSMELAALLLTEEKLAAAVKWCAEEDVWALHEVVEAEKVRTRPCPHWPCL